MSPDGGAPDVGTKGKRSGHATITDVAKLAGVSIKTVSRVVNAEANVRPETRERVLAASRELQYEPNPSARGLAGRRSFTLGLVYEENPNEFGYLKDVLTGAGKACRDAGYGLLLQPCRYPGDDIAGEIRRFVTQTGIDGLVITPPLGDVEVLTALLDELEVPYAQVSPRQERPDWFSVTCNDREATREMTEYVIGLGHRRIGFIRGDPEHGASSQRLKGYAEALKAHDIRYEAGLVRQGYFDFESGCRAARRLLELPEPPTAIIASNDEMAAGVLFVAREMGLELPRDLSVTGFDDSPTAAHIWPRLTTVKQPVAEMSATAATVLIEGAAGRSVDSLQHEFQCRIITRESTAKFVD